MARFASLSRVKTIASIDFDDAGYDQILRGMLEQASEDVERMTRRKFEWLGRTEQFKSYDQDGIDPTPQWIYLNGPVDTGETFTLTFAGGGDHSSSGSPSTLVQDTDYTLDATEGVITILPKSPAALQNAIPVVGGLFYQNCPTGFQVVYTGGYKRHTSTDDYVTVPDGLQNVIAVKVARDFLDCKALKPWTEDEQNALKPWRKRDIFF